MWQNKGTMFAYETKNTAFKFVGHKNIISVLDKAVNNPLI